ncbi:MAG: TrbG/VirB9 family P-type conjugative transfer protein [Desulfuromonadales bacterium]|nr:TrbG/VirB9 family P-type conjugative transfer protein [Desulfuromonadales bacterium]
MSGIRIRYGLALVGLVVTVSYANTNSTESPPLGVVTKEGSKVIEQIPTPVAVLNQPAPPTVPGIPQNIQNTQGQFPEEAVKPQEPEGTLSATSEGEDNQKFRKKKAQKAPEATMPLLDKRVMDSAINSATQRPGNSANSESKVVYSYTPDSMYTIYGAPGRVIDVQLQPGEKLTSPVIAGDTVRWVVGSATSRSGTSSMTHVLIKPIQAGLETNFIITTDHHAYHLIAKSFNRTFLPAVA